MILSPSLADKQVISATERIFAAQQEEGPSEESGPIVWSETEGEELNQGIRLKIQHPKVRWSTLLNEYRVLIHIWTELTGLYTSTQVVNQVAWHAKGDYLASVMPDHSSHQQVFIHQVSRQRSQNPFRRNKGLVQCVCFHPVRPYFFVATQRSVRIYNLVKQEMTKKLQANSKWISSIAVHPGGKQIQENPGSTLHQLPSNPNLRWSLHC